MLRRALDKRWVRVMLAILFGVPAAILALSLVGLGLWLPLRVSEPGDWYAFVIAPLAALATLGVVGLWRRLLKPHSVMTGRERAQVRALLLNGIIANAGFAVFTVLLFEEDVLVPVFTVVAGMGLVFILATPNSE